MDRQNTDQSRQYDHRPQDPTATAFSWRTLCFWLVALALLWALLSAGRGWYLGAPFVLLAALTASLVRLQPWTLRLSALPGFVAFFLHKSLLGAWDVARRTLRPIPDIKPGWDSYQLASNDPRVRLLLSAIMGLLPGTLTSQLDEGNNLLRIHLLDTGQNWRPTVQQLEHQLCRLLTGEVISP